MVLVALVTFVILITAAVIFGSPVDMANWVFQRLGFSGVRKSAPPMQSSRTAEVVESVGTTAKGSVPTIKVFWEGALWDADCEPDLAARLSPGDRVEIVSNQSVRLWIKGKV